MKNKIRVLDCILVCNKEINIGPWSRNTFINNETIYMGKLYKGKIVFGHCQNDNCLVIEKRKGPSINTEHEKMNFALILVRKIGDYLK